LDIINHELDQLKFRITQFLHTSRIETMEKGKEEVCIASLIDNLLSFVYPSIVDADVNIVANIEPDLIINAHKDELKQVLLNIIFNSLDAVRKKEKEKKIFVECIRKEDSISCSSNDSLTSFILELPIQ
jgi:signal transduction histidine kinase